MTREQKHELKLHNKLYELYHIAEAMRSDITGLKYDHDRTWHTGYNTLDTVVNDLMRNLVEVISDEQYRDIDNLKTLR